MSAGKHFSFFQNREGVAIMSLKYIQAKCKKKSSDLHSY